MTPQQENTLDRFKHSTVAQVARMPGPAADALFDMVAGGRNVWSYRDWLIRLAELDACDETIEEFRAFR